MELREVWERNTRLAEAFCGSDERVRQAQAVLDEAQAERTRTLAAFAVTVGSDGAVADLMGLQEREVRVARRTVGKSDARTVAEEFLAARPGPPVPEPAAQPPEGEQPPPPAEPSLLSQRDQPQPPAPETAAYVPVSVTDPVPGPGDPVTWSASMDSVLQWSWQSGLDLQTVADELGINIRVLLLRAQALAAEGRLAARPAAVDSSRSGRHRRGDLPWGSVPDSPESLYHSRDPGSWEQAWQTSAANEYSGAHAWVAES
ncbi:hypothetical protein [Streptomyces sp. NPDC007088]|uniref:hypothetical protein n=1 Tax=Streptomyces sp. NPDC007088 TaxID=3364773 RepID=UPI0036CF7783